MIFLKCLFQTQYFAGLVLQPASEAEEDEVCRPRQHPLASTLLPHKKSKFSILGAAVRGRPGEIFTTTWKRYLVYTHPSPHLLCVFNTHNRCHTALVCQCSMFYRLSEPKYLQKKIKSRKGHFEEAILLCTIPICGGNRKLLIAERMSHVSTVC